MQTESDRYGDAVGGVRANQGRAEAMVWQLARWHNAEAVPKALVELAEAARDLVQHDQRIAQLNDRLAVA